MISKPIRLTASGFSLSVTLASCHSQEESKIFNVNTFRGQKQLQPFSSRKHVYNMENFEYKFVLMTDIHQTVKVILFATSPVYFVSFSQQRQFYTLLPLPWGKSLFASRFWGFRWPARNQDSFKLGRKPWERCCPLTSSGGCQEESGGSARPAKSKMTPKWCRPLTYHSMREIIVTTFFVSTI